MNMLEVIVSGAGQAARHGTPPAASQQPADPPGPSPKRAARTAPCPFCGSDPPLAAQIAGRYVVGCESEDCAANPQVSGASPGEAWTRWNSRAA
jgi:hypothetical protein